MLLWRRIQAGIILRDINTFELSRSPLGGSGADAGLSRLPLSDQCGGAVPPGASAFSPCARGSLPAAETGPSSTGENKTSRKGAKDTKISLRAPRALRETICVAEDYRPAPPSNDSMNSF